MRHLFLTTLCLILMAEIQIELLLAMKSPTGSAKLLIAHFREWRVSLTTFIVMLYLFVNVTGRLSVAIFGLTYNLEDKPIEIPPTLITDWNSTVLFAGNGTKSEGEEKGIRKNSTLNENTSFLQQILLTLHAVSYLELVRGGLATFANGPFFRFNTSGRQHIDDMILDALRVSDLISLQIQDGINFGYSIQEFGGVSRDLTPSDHSVNSTATCTMFRLDGDKYWKDYDNNNQSSKGMLYKSHGRLTDGRCYEAYINLGNRLDR